jgi:hypothetical protein
LTVAALIKNNNNYDRPLFAAAALYADGGLADLKCLETTIEDGDTIEFESQFTLSGGAAGHAVKVFAWGGLKDMRPAAKLEPVPRSEFPPPDAAAAAGAKSLLDVGYAHFFGNWNNGDFKELSRAAAFAVLARAIAAGTAGADTVAQYARTVKKIINEGAHMPSISAGVDARSQYPAVFAIAAGWRKPEIRALFTAEEQARILTLAKACIVSGAYVSANYNGEGQLRSSAGRTAMNGDGNTYISANYAEGALGLFLAGITIYGKGKTAALLDGYSHDAFKRELEDRELTAVLQCFEETDDNTVEGVVRNITKNDRAGKPFYGGIEETASVRPVKATIEHIMADPVRLFLSMVETTYSRVAREGIYIGEVGMLQEFGSTDGGSDGNEFHARDSLQYSALGMVNSMHSRYLMNFGHWNNSADEAAKAKIDALMTIGASDVAGKLYNGYWSRQNGGMRLDCLRDIKNRYSGSYAWYAFMEELALGQGLMNKTLFYTNWQSQTQINPALTIGPNNPDRWAAANARWTHSGFDFEDDTPWTGKGPLSNGAAPNRVLVSAAAVPSAASVTDDITEIAANGCNYEFFCKLKVRAFGNPADDPKVGVMFRAADADNCYVIRYRANSRRFELRKRVGGIDGAPLAVSEEFELSEGGLYTNLYNFRVVVNGNHIEFVLGYDAGGAETLQEQLSNMTPRQIALIDYTDDSAPLLSGSKIGFLSAYSDAAFDDAFVTETRRTQN